MNNLRIHCIQHEMFETPGCILNWAKAHGFPVSYTHIYKNDQLPQLVDFDFLLIMGGSMSAYDDEKISWIRTEKELIRKAIDANKYVVGICLGSQLIASALGARVFINRYKEIGFFPLYLSSVAKKMSMFKGFKDKMYVFHWHGDTFDMPINAKHLAYSHACHNQGFLYNDRVLALQCHMEITIEIMEDLFKNFAAELISSPYVQSADEMRNHLDSIPRMNQVLYDMLDSLILFRQ